MRKRYFDVEGRIIRLAIAYFIGLNVWGLVLALSFVLGGLTHIGDWFGLIGLIGGIAAGIVAGRWVYRSMHWVRN